MISEFDRTFTAILRAAVSGESGTEGLPAPSAGDWRAFQALAVRHNVQGLLYDGIKAASKEFNVNLPVDVAARLLSDSLSIEASHAAMHKLEEKLTALWAENGVGAEIVKGTRAAQRYPRPEARVLGDLDWWIPSRKDRDKALEAIKRLGAEPQKDSDGDVHFTMDGIVVELHKKRMDGDAHVLHHACVYGAEFRHLCDCAAARAARGAGPEAPCPRRWRAVMDGVSDFILAGRHPGRAAARFVATTLDGAATSRRMLLVFSICPLYFIGRLAGLAVGRIRRI